MKLRLYHGRNNPEQAMDNWGFEGATLNGIDGIIWTYGVPRVFFVNDNALTIAKALTGWDELGDGLEMRVYEDLIKTKEGYFGDWELIRM
ncbi:TPA: ABC transporter substrate-binding protein [Legionella pneumophila]|nr:ABC transporter substrate-binding protein [Legionella pneumophila]HAU9905872.1 ABC transporter substrate-binding protein [Legionella pneumophila]HAU9927318.1 ABC transporter substrate-binding protein [Legionella pneumophila]HAU9930251.1 ABC transporter substrate-binding protein [Legionella pneumophila]HAU9933921.1 ABC transporter substrate-binding protein [Legionella pneumophila]